VSIVFFADFFGVNVFAVLLLVIALGESDGSLISFLPTVAFFLAVLSLATISVAGCCSFEVTSLVSFAFGLIAASTVTVLLLLFFVVAAATVLTAAGVEGNLRAPKNEANVACCFNFFFLALSFLPVEGAGVILCPSTSVVVVAFLCLSLSTWTDDWTGAEEGDASFDVVIDWKAKALASSDATAAATSTTSRDGIFFALSCTSGCV